LRVDQQKGSVATPVDRQESPRTESTAACTAAGQAERLTRLCGAGAPFRPLSQPRHFLSFGAGDLPLLPQGKIPPDKTL